jgi:hypothetical protein
MQILKNELTEFSIKSVEKDEIETFESNRYHGLTF